MSIVEDSVSFPTLFGLGFFVFSSHILYSLFEALQEAKASMDDKITGGLMFSIYLALQLRLTTNELITFLYLTIHIQSKPNK